LHEKSGKTSFLKINLVNIKMFQQNEPEKTRKMILRNFLLPFCLYSIHKFQLEINWV